MNKPCIGHPDDGDLLRYADGELSGREAKRIAAHVASCWKCRTELSAIEQTIAECVQYREKVLPAHLPEPPASWGDIYSRFADADAELRQRSWSIRLWETVQTAFVYHRRWAVATALVLVVALVVDQLQNAPSVQAAELLDRATIAEQVRPERLRNIEFHTADATVTKAFGPDARKVAADDQETLDTLEPLFEAAHYSWDDPLSAASYAAWRESLASKQDEVATITDRAEPANNRYQIRTTTDSSELREATLELTAADLHAVEGRFRFRSTDWIELREVAPAPIVEQPAPIASLPEPAHKAAPEAPAPAEVVRPATPGEELQVLAVLRQLGADLGEPVEVTREPNRILVSGYGVSPAMTQQIEQALASVPYADVQLSEPQPISAAPLAAAPAPARSVVSQPDSTALQDELEQRLGGRAAYEQFTEEELRLTDDLMARAHALRRLAEHFPQPVEAQLSADDRVVLAKLRLEHAQALAGIAAALEERSRIALGDPSADSTLAPPMPVTTWQDETESIFLTARRAERFVAAILGGASTQTPTEALPDAAMVSLAQLRRQAANYVRIALE